MLGRGLASAFEELRPLIGRGMDVLFEIQADRILLDGQEVTELGAGPWRMKLREAGIESLAFEADIDLSGFERRFHEIARRLELYGPTSAKLDDIGPETVVHDPETVVHDVEQTAPAVSEVAPSPEVREERPAPELPDGVSPVELPNDAPPLRAPTAPGDPREERQPAPAEGPSLDEEADLVRWIHGEIARTGRLPSTETRGIVESLRGLEAAGEPSVASPFLLAPADGYTTSHCLSVALMAAALAAYLEYDGDELELVTEAALLHDIGKVRLPLEDTGPDGLTAEQRSVMERHPAEGARVLLAGPPKHTLSAVVAYEHHMAWRGDAGYPPRHYPRNGHRFSRLVQICDAYDVLRSARSFRPALSHESALEYMRLQASSTLDPDLVTAFADLCGARPLPRIPGSAAGGHELGTIELSRMPEGAFDPDIETPPIRL